MTAFVQMESSKDGLVWVNPDRITRLRTSGEYTVVSFGPEDEVAIKEPISKVLEMLKEADKSR
jgi:hypothetical protein